jgi:hypothetical protein
MPNINVNKTSSDTGDNVKRSSETTHIDYKGISLLVVVAFSIFIIVWIIILAIAGVRCWSVSAFICYEATYVFWGGITIIISSVITALVGFIMSLDNIRYQRWRGVITHRSDIKKYAEQIISVAQTSARSEATAGMDNYSPSIDNSNAASVAPVVEVDEQPFNDIVIPSISFDESEK